MLLLTILKFFYRGFGLLIFLCLISGCKATIPAPIVNGWHQQPAGGQSAYIVQKGDTLYSIAWAFSMDFRVLAAINHLSPPYDIHAGQRLEMVKSGTIPIAVQPTSFIPVRPTVVITRKPHATITTLERRPVPTPMIVR